jgi:hypothetical protein
MIVQNSAKASAALGKMIYGTGKRAQYSDKLPKRVSCSPHGAGADTDQSSVLHKP